VNGLTLRLDGREPLSAGTVQSLNALCDQTEDRAGQGPVVLYVSGAPDGPWTRDLTVALVSAWERALRRLERLPAATITVASGECGGTALDVLLATDVRVASATTVLRPAVNRDATWPSMTLFRLTQQAGAAQIRRAALFGVPIPADRALALNLIDEIADDPAAALALATTFSGPELAIRRQLMFNATATGFEDALGTHLAACDRALRRTSAAAVQ
jgi:isomerase DpgB